MRIQRTKNRTGSAALEFALWFFPMMIILSGIIDLSWYMSLRENLQRAARDGARAGAAAIENEEAAATTAGQDVLDGIGFVCPNAMTVTSPTASISGFDFESFLVIAECDFEAPIGLLPFLGVAPELNKVSAKFVMISEVL